MSCYENHSLPVRAIGGVRVVVNEIPGGTRSFIHMVRPLKITWVCCVAFYAYIGASMDESVTCKITWCVIFAVLWTVAFAAFASLLDKID